MYYVYVLLSEKDLQFYTGFTNNLKIRFDEHCKGRVKSTANRVPLKLVYYEACLHRDDATHREKYLKSTYGKCFIRQRIKNFLLEGLQT